MNQKFVNTVLNESCLTLYNHCLYHRGPVLNLNILINILHFDSLEIKIFTDPGFIMCLNQQGVDSNDVWLFLFLLNITLTRRRIQCCPCASRRFVARASSTTRKWVPVYQTNKSQVFDEISMLENWLIIHGPFLSYTRGKATFNDLEDSSCVKHG